MVRGTAGGEKPQKYKVDLDLIEALSFQKTLDNPRFSFSYSENLVIASFRASDDVSMRSCEHSHEAYEFLIPHTPIPYLTNEDAVYFGEVGMLYPVQSSRKHGTKYPISNVGYTSIAIKKEYFDKIMRDKNVKEYTFNSVITCSDSIISLIEMFKNEFSKGQAADLTYKLEPLSLILCSEIIDLALAHTNDDRKSKTKYQKGVRLAADYINENFSKNITIDKLAEMCGLSLNYFSLCFRNTFGETPKVYITKMRLSKAKTLLEFSSLQIKEIATVCGFQKFNSFSCSFKKYIGMTPSEYREGLNLQIQ